MPAVGWRDLGNLRLKRVMRYQRQGAACIGAPDPATGSDYAASDVFSSTRPAGAALKQLVWSMVRVEPTEVGALQVLQAVQNTNAAACTKFFVKRLDRHLSKVLHFGGPKVKIAKIGTQAVRVRVVVPLHMHVHGLAQGVPIPTDSGAVALTPSVVKTKVSRTVLAKADKILYFDQIYAVRGRVVIAAGFVSVGAPFSAKDETAWFRPMYARAKRVPVAVSSPPGTIILPPPTVTPITPFKLTITDAITAPGVNPSIQYPSGWSGDAGPPVELHTCPGGAAVLGISSGQKVPGTNVTIIEDGTCEARSITVVPFTPKKCKPSVLDYIDLSYMYDCKSNAPKVPLGPGAAGAGQMPFIIAFPGITVM
jgi:hypothetical protein